MSTSPNLNPQVAASLALWHEMVAQQDLGQLPSILRDDAVFRSPMAFKPYVSAAAVNLILTTVVQVFKDFTYHRTLVSDDGLNVVLEFSATVGDKQLKGIDMIRFDEDGQDRGLRGDGSTDERAAGPGRRDGRTPGRVSAGLQSPNVSIWTVRNPHAI
jgi:hypothetical protein